MGTKIYTQNKAWKMLLSQRKDSGGSFDKALYGYENKPLQRPSTPLIIIEKEKEKKREKRRIREKGKKRRRKGKRARETPQRLSASTARSRVTP